MGDEIMCKVPNIIQYKHAPTISSSTFIVLCKVYIVHGYTCRDTRVYYKEMVKKSLGGSSMDISWNRS